MNRRSFISSLLASTVVPWKIPNITGGGAKISVDTTSPSDLDHFRSLNWVDIGKLESTVLIGHTIEIEAPYHYK